MKTLKVIISIKPSPELRDSDLKLSLEHVAKDMILLKYETLVQRAHIAKLNTFANVASERLGIPFHDAGDLDIKPALTTYDAIKRELEEYAATSMPFLPNTKIGIELVDKHEGIPVISDLPDEHT